LKFFKRLDIIFLINFQLILNKKFPDLEVVKILADIDAEGVIKFEKQA